MIQTNTMLLLVTSSVWAVTHVLALELFLYWRYQWFDLPMHFLGGVVVALCFFSLRDFRVPVPKRWYRLVPVTLGVLIVALVWEYYEVFIGIPIEPNYEIDTLSDLCMGTLGGMVGYFIASRISRVM